MQRRDLKGRGLDAGLERWAGLQWMGGRRNSKQGSRKEGCGLGTVMKLQGFETSHGNESLPICRGKVLALAQRKPLIQEKKKKFHYPQ